MSHESILVCYFLSGVFLPWIFWWINTGVEMLQGRLGTDMYPLLLQVHTSHPHCYSSVGIFWAPYTIESSNCPENFFSVKMPKIGDGRFPTLAAYAGLWSAVPHQALVLSGASLSFLPSMYEVLLHQERRNSHRAHPRPGAAAAVPWKQASCSRSLCGIWDVAFYPKICTQVGEGILGRKQTLPASCVL